MTQERVSGVYVNAFLNVETWALAGTGVLVAAAVAAIRLGWRRGKRMGDP